MPRPARISAASPACTPSGRGVEALVAHTHLQDGRGPVSSTHEENVRSVGRDDRHIDENPHRRPSSRALPPTEATRTYDRQPQPMDRHRHTGPNPTLMWLSPGSAAGSSACQVRPSNFDELGTSPARTLTCLNVMSPKRRPAQSTAVVLGQSPRRQRSAAVVAGMDEPLGAGCPRGRTADPAGV